MRQSLSDTLSSSSSASATKPKRRRWTREQLLKNLEILNNLEAPLPPTLPPSPPASRSASPAPGYKRKSESSSDPDSAFSTSKRPRTSSFVDKRHAQPQHPYHPHHAHQPPHSHQPPNAPPPSSSQPPPTSHPHSTFASRQEPEEGEVREEPLVPVQAPSIPAPPKAALDVPIRRPKRGKVPLRHFDNLHDIYHNQGRMLKYSGDARFWSTYPPTHREYRPLADPPPPNSPYHKHGGLIARLELVDALICFTFSIWNRDYGRRACNKETWATIEAFLIWCKQKWQAEEGINDAEKAFIGLIWMIEAFIHGRKLYYTAKDHLDHETNNLTKSMKASISKAADAAEAATGGAAGSLNTKSNGTPIMLPSPASIAPANSANSTPTYRDNGTPSSGPNSRQASTAQPPPRAHRMQNGPSPVPFPLLPSHLANSPLPIPPDLMKAMAEVREPIGPALAQDLRDFVVGFHASSWCMSTSQTTLNLPIIMRCFPTTFNRMMHSTLLPTEEHEPDFEDEEGELFWPGQLVNGEGLGWVCLMGKAMIKEFGKAYGYKGIDGVVPKPKPEDAADDASTHRNANSVPSGHSSNQYHSSSSHGHR